MAVQNVEDLMMNTLNKLYASEQRLQKAAEELSQSVSDPEVKDILNVRAFLTGQSVDNLAKCFQILGKSPSKVDNRFAEVWVEDTGRELNAIQNPTLRALYALSAIRKIQDYHIAQYAFVNAVAYHLGNEALSLLLEHAMADKVAFVERTREIVRDMVRQALGDRVKERMAAREAA